MRSVPSRTPARLSAEYSAVAALVEWVPLGSRSRHRFSKTPANLFVLRPTTLEHLDAHDAPREEVARTLRFLRWLNGSAGGGRASVEAVSREFGAERNQQPFRLLDIGTGAADLPIAVVRAARAAGREIEVTAIDAHPEVVSAATLATREWPEIRVLHMRAEELSSTFADGSFDVAHASMTLHHFKDEDVRTMLHVMGRLATRRVIVNDLVRDRIGRVVVWVITLGTSAMVRHDARLSVAKGFTMSEIADAGRVAGLGGVTVRRHRAGRFLLSARAISVDKGAVDARQSQPPMTSSPVGCDEARQNYTRSLFDATASCYDRVESVTSLGTGAWYRRRSLCRAGLRAGQRVLDVGCGTGRIAAMAREIVGPEGDVLAIDPCPAMLAIAARRDGVRTAAGHAELLQIADASVDFVVMGYALRHVTDLGAAFREFARVLRPGGRVLVLELTRPRGVAGGAAFDAVAGWAVPAVSAIVAPRGGWPLMRYFWRTCRACVPSSTIVDALESAGLARVRHRGTLGVFTEYLAEAPRR